MNIEAFEKVLKISEEFFETQSDLEQMPINQDSADKLNSIHPDTVLYKFDSASNPIAWSVVVPTSISVMNRFLDKEISEKQLLVEATREKRFEALYLCAVFVLPEYRRKGHAKKLLIKQVNQFAKDASVKLYVWIYSKEGEGLVRSLKKDLNREILNRE